MSTKHILFVEHQGQILQQAMRTLAVERPAWHIMRVTTPEAALEIMSQYQIGVLIAECAANWTACEQMFKRFKAQDPAVVRIALVGEMDNRCRPDSFLYINQFLVSACAPIVVQQVIENGLMVWAMAMTNPRMVELVMNLRSIPTPPMLYFDIKDELDSPQGSLQGIARLLSRDPALTAKILKIANSGLYAPSRSITDLGMAIGLLGTDLVLALVLGAHLYNQLPVPGLNLDKMWLHSMAVSSLAKKIAEDEIGDRQLASAAGVAGLLHDVGQLVLLAQDAASYFGAIHRCEGNEEKLVEIEREQFGVDHAQLGGYLLALWGLPENIVDAVRGHQGVLDGMTHPLPITVRAVFVAEWLLQEYAVHKELLGACTVLETQSVISSSHAAQWWQFVDHMVEQGIVA
jgi:HD-like signal output (HDOD) protein